MQLFDRDHHLEEAKDIHRFVEVMFDVRLLIVDRIHDDQIHRRNCCQMSFESEMSTTKKTIRISFEI